MTTADLTHVDHLIVGAGFGGLCAAIKLEEDGERDFVVIEKGSGVGGTWRDNTYPGAACDVPSQLYSYSFALNPDWSMSFSPQPEIEAYIKKVAEGSGTLDRFVFDTAMTAATWDETQQRWLVETEGKAGKKTYAATTVIAGPGALSEPKLPDIEGIEGFQGEIFHSAQWNHDVSLEGKRVAVIGTGASSIQIVPEIQKKAARLDVYQRTAPWVLPRNEHRYSKLEKAAFRHVPGVQRLARAAVYWGLEVRVLGLAVQPKLTLAHQLMAQNNIRRGIKDPELRRKVTPDYTLGCKRTLISNAYYPALDADNVDLITDGIDRVSENAIVAKDGTSREIDVLVVATGFYTTDLPIAHAITGSKGRTMAERFSETGMSAYKGTTVPEFPNLFFVVGPNTGLGHSSMVYMIESQVAYIRDAIRTMRTNAYATVEPTEDATSAWNDDLQRKMDKTVWSEGGCASWYLDEHGRNTTLWPSFTFLFRHLTSKFDVDKYVVTAASTQHADTTQESVPA